MTTCTPSTVRMEGVTKRYGDGPAVLADVSTSISAGQLVGVIGPSGCGKTTLLKLVAGLSPVTSGSLLLDGRPPAAGTGEVVFIFQEPTLLPWLTARRNVELPLLLRGIPGPERRAAASRLLELVGLADAASLHPRQLSGGMKMRVSLARSLALEPRLLLLDEPFGALDEMTRNRLNEELLALRARQPWTGLFVTHSVGEAVFLADRILILTPQPGRIHRDILVGLPDRRTPELRESVEYTTRVREVTHWLREAEQAGMEAAP